MSATGNILVVAFNALLAIGLLYWAATQLDQRVKNPSEYHYTTCFITNIRSYKEDSDGEGAVEHRKEVTFVYGLSNDDWDQVGKFDARKKDWKGVPHAVGDIGTCLYTLNGDRSMVDDPFTLHDYLTHNDTNTMWMVVDDKYIWISWIIFFSIACLFSMCFGYAISASGSCSQSPIVTCGIFCGIWLFAFWCANWPFMIMASVVQGGFDGRLSDVATVDDVYVDINDCRIDNIEDTVYFGDQFSLVKYNVFTENGNMMAIDLSSAPIAEYFDIGTWHSCFQNMYSNQIILNGTVTPSVEWLRAPTARVPLTVAISLVCIPIVFAMIGPCLMLMTGCCGVCIERCC